MEDELFTVYVTKWCLSKGIEESIVKEYRNPDGFKYFSPCEKYSTLLVPGKEAFLTREAAENDARARAKKKVESLRRQLEKMEKLSLEPKWAKKGSK